MNQTDNRMVNTIFWAVVMAVVAIAAGSFALSFNALHELARQNGQPLRLAWIWPVIVDISLVIYTAAVLVAQLQRRPARLPGALVIGYGLVTIAGNLMHAPNTPAGYFVAALPPLSLVLGTELLRVMARHQIEYRAAIAALADLTTHQQQLTGERDRLVAEIERLTVKAQEIKTEIKASQTGAYTRISESTKAAALAILTERSDISGAELGRELGKSDSTGRKLRRELLPLVAANGHGRSAQ